jgi:subtilisin family serine protease
MFPAFSIGNSGPSCGSAGSPGDYPESFASGSVDSSGVIAYDSSRGPGSFTGASVKPDLTAPGVAVCSTVPDDDYTCGYSGTSMASPHTAGAVALLWSASPVLRMDIEGTKALLRNTANPNVPDAGTCGGPTELQALVPNYTYGYGYLDVFAAMKEAVVYDIPWISENPETGSVPGGNSLDVDILFDATGLATGVYTGTLRITHNDPLTGNVDVPVTLTVTNQWNVYLPLVLQ